MNRKRRASDSEIQARGQAEGCDSDWRRRNALRFFRPTLAGSGRPARLAGEPAMSLSPSAPPSRRGPYGVHLNQKATSG
jgi:hypothetical protein